MFRPGKGWLRHKGAAVSAAAPQDLGKDGSDSDMKVQSSMHLTPFGTDSLLPTSTSSLSASQLTSLSGKEAALRVAGRQVHANLLGLAPGSFAFGWWAALAGGRHLLWGVCNSWSCLGAHGVVCHICWSRPPCILQPQMGGAWSEP